MAVTEMPVFEVQIRAELENVEFLEPIKSNLFKFNIGNGSGEERSNVTVCMDDVLELEGSRGTANYIMKWDKKDQHQAYMKILDVLPYSNKSNEFSTIMRIECRGIITPPVTFMTTCILYSLRYHRIGNN